MCVCVCMHVHTYDTYVHTYMRTYVYTDHNGGLIGTQDVWGSVFFFCFAYFLHAYIRITAAGQLGRRTQYIHIHTCINTHDTYIHTCIQTYTHTRSLFLYLSLSLTHTHTHLCAYTYSSMCWDDKRDKPRQGLQGYRGSENAVCPHPRNSRRRRRPRTLSHR